jgi:hypothetical protein
VGRRKDCDKPSVTYMIQDEDQPDFTSPWYIGSSHAAGRTALRASELRARHTIWVALRGPPFISPSYRWIHDRLEEGKRYKVVILEELPGGYPGLWVRSEIYWIRWYRDAGWEFANVSPGGYKSDRRRMSQYQVNQYTSARRSEAISEVWKRPEYQERQRAARSRPEYRARVAATRAERQRQKIEVTRWLREIRCQG